MLNKKMLIIPLIGLLSTSSTFAAVSDVDQFLQDYESTPEVTTTMLVDDMVTQEAPVPTLYTEEKVTNVNSNILSWKYLGNGIILVWKTKVKITSKHLKHLVKDDSVELNITWNIKSFTINSITKNWVILEDEKVITKTVSKTLEGTTFEWVYLGKNIIEINWIKVKVISKKLSTITEGTKVKLTIDWTIKSFKLVSLEVL